IAFHNTHAGLTPNTFTSAVAINPNESYIATAEGGVIMLRDIRSGALLRTFEGHQDTVTAIAFSPDSRYLASSSLDKTIRLWDVSNQKNVFAFRGHASGVTCVVFSPDGRYVASASMDHTVRLWNTESGLAFTEADAVTDVGFPLSGINVPKTMTFSPD